MKRMDIVIAGNSFAGYTAAIQLKQLVGPDHEVIVIGRSPQFVFSPSLIWYPFGLRSEDEIMFDVRRPFLERDIKFFEAEIVKFDPDNNRVWLHGEYFPYDYFVVATGIKHDFSDIPGAGPGRYSHCICSLNCAREARRAWKEYLLQGGPVVVSASKGTGFYSAAYELILNMGQQLAIAGKAGEATLTFVTSEPHIGHLGIGGFANLREIFERLFTEYRINWITGAEIKEVVPEMLILKSGEEIRSKYTVIIPSFSGSDAVRNTSGFCNEKGLIQSNDEYRHHDYPNVYAVGGAVAISEDEDEEEFALQSANYPAEIMAKTAAWNIFADIYGMDKRSLPFSDVCAYSKLDAGNQGIMIIGDHMLTPKGIDSMFTGPSTHWSKVAYEKFYIYSKSRGNV